MPKSYYNARILMYHSISDHVAHERHNKWRVKPKDFDKQMKWFYKNGWYSLTISELVELEKIPCKTFVLTFDDGFEDNFTNAFPILKKYNFKATIYLVPNQISNQWDSKHTSEITTLLTSEQIKIMQKSGLIEFGSHTLSHTDLLSMTKEDIKKELIESKKQVELLTDTECKSFAYPYGRFNDEIVNEVMASGYKNATIVRRGLYMKKDNPFVIKRIGILGTESFFDFYLKITRIRNKI